MIYGTNGKLQFGLESEYGTVPTLTKQIGVKSEGFKYVPNKKNEGLLLGGKTGSKSFTMSKGAEGTLQTTVRPDDLGYYIGMAFGVEDSVTQVGTSLAYEHVFSPSADELPSATFSVDRVAQVYDYPGSVVNTLSFSASPEDYLIMDLGLICKTEVEGVAQTPISVSPLKPLRFYHGAVSIGGVEVADVTSVKFNYANGVEKIFTTASGEFPKQPEVGVRECKVDLEVLYSADSEEYRQDYFVEDGELALKLEFISDEEIESGKPYKFEITIPAAQITDSAPANLTGPDKLKQTFTVTAIEPGLGADFIAAKLTNATALKYIV